jgi:uncharacterized membrane protein
MKTQSKTDRLQLAIASLLAAGSLIAAQTASADPAQEQCAGIVKAGKNDCATSSNACHGHVERNADPEAWIYVPAGTCERIAGARIVKVVDPTPADKRK